MKDRKMKRHNLLYMQVTDPAQFRNHGMKSTQGFYRELGFAVISPFGIFDKVRLYLFGHSGYSISQKVGPADYLHIHSSMMP